MARSPSSMVTVRGPHMKPKASASEVEADLALAGRPNRPKLRTDPKCEGNDRVTRNGNWPKPAITKGRVLINRRQAAGCHLSE
jgi:hypothetical protein